MEKCIQFMCGCICGNVCRCVCDSQSIFCFTMTDCEPLSLQEEQLQVLVEATVCE